MSVPAFAVQSFGDVATTHWAYDYIEYAASNGIVEGIGDGRFEPDGTLTAAQFLAIITRGFYADEINMSGAEGAWYARNVDVASRHNLLDGVSILSLDENVTRYQMALIIYNMMSDLGWSMLSDADRETALSMIADYKEIPAEYVPAVTNVYSMGIITGIDSVGTFAGDMSMTRAQVTVVYCRMAQKINGELQIGEKYNGSGIADKTAHLTVDGNIYSLQMSEADLVALAGEPDEKLVSFIGYTWYVYGTDTYDDFFMAGIYDSKVAALCSAGVSFDYIGYTMGTTGLSSGKCNDYAVLYTDKNDNGILHAVCLSDYDNYVFRLGISVNDTSMAGESMVVFHLTNAFRHYHGLKILEWSDAAAKAAELHSQDMADQDYFDHTSADGRTPWQRMTEQNISYGSAAENIDGGYGSGILAYNGWVNSSGHRRNMLSVSMRYLGVGFGYNSRSSYKFYATQDFYG